MSWHQHKGYGIDSERCRAFKPPGRLAILGHPILGDSLYADDAVRLAAPRMLLHACMLDLGMAEDEQKPWRFQSPVPF